MLNVVYDLLNRRLENPILTILTITMPKEISFAADQPTIHLLFGNSAIKEINAYVPKKVTMMCARCMP